MVAAGGADRAGAVSSGEITGSGATRLGASAEGDDAAPESDRRTSPGSSMLSDGACGGGMRGRLAASNSARARSSRG